ncbi:MAG TPA: EscU/YscU/HrcU family type III secretion system export apparatus switch protein, partial [Polyangiaceae bacterium]|nr:EscU/YscU/HrcU family type III secretion system export apparatus switch protein [Polyangiaceae bacterium]
MADDRGQATEQPTPRRLDKARKDGRFPVSREMLGAAQFLSFAMLMAGTGGAWCAGLMDCLRWMIGQAFRAELSPRELERMALVIALKHLA